MCTWTIFYESEDKTGKSKKKRLRNYTRKILSLMARDSEDDWYKIYCAIYNAKCGPF